MASLADSPGCGFTWAGIRWRTGLDPACRPYRHADAGPDVDADRSALEHAHRNPNAVVDADTQSNPDRDGHAHTVAHSQHYVHAKPNANSKSDAYHHPDAHLQPSAGTRPGAVQLSLRPRCRLSLRMGSVSQGQSGDLWPKCPGNLGVCGPLDVRRRLLGKGVIAGCLSG